jgi:hypothetical protein
MVFRGLDLLGYIQDFELILLVGGLNAWEKEDSDKHQANGD